MKLAKASECTGCGACAASCKHGAIKMDYDSNGFLQPKIDANKCTECGLCEKRCPIIHTDKINFHSAQGIRHLAAWSKSDEVCLQATSGGIFTQLAIDLLKEGNSICFGVENKNDNTCQHIGISDIVELPRIIGTKYSQSDASASYPQVLKRLREGKNVLFCGTPCQVAALYSFLGNKEYDNLFTADLICHGVPSKYVADITCRYYGAEYIASYRDKKDGWCAPGLVRVSQILSFNKKGKIIRPKESLFWKMFANAHRDCCTQCKFAVINRVADLSLGDLWGGYKNYPERGRLGASLVIVNTEKGVKLMNSSSFEVYEHEKKELNCYTLFYPGCNKSVISLSHFLGVINKLPTKMAITILSLDWRHNPMLLPLALLYKLQKKNHVKRTLQEIERKKKELGWK